jgi:RHS repeat-associated protein
VLSQRISRGADTRTQTYGYTESGTVSAGRLTCATEALGATGILCNQGSPSWQQFYGYDSRDNQWLIDSPGLPIPTDETPRGSGWYGSNNLTTVTQSAIQRTFVYDSLKRLVRATNPESGEISYSYDDNGNLKSKIDSRTLPGPPPVKVAATLTYDSVNRLKTKTYNDGTPGVTYTYDQDMREAGDSNPNYFVGRLSQISSTPSTTTYNRYDALGRVTASRQDTGALYRFGYAYNDQALETMTYPSQTRQVKTCYDAVGRIQKVQNGTGANAPSYVSGIQYTPHGAISQMTVGPGASGIFTEQWQYSPGRLQPTSVDVTGRLSLRYFYCLNELLSCQSNNGSVRRQRILSPLNVTQDYTYDGLDRLLTATETGGTDEWSQTYSYDVYGNRAVLSGSFVPRIEWTPRALTEYETTTNRWKRGGGDQYDAAGNQTAVASDQAPNVVSSTFGYDAENRLITANVANTGSVFYEYDGEGRRVKKTVGSAVTVYVYDATGQLAAEYSNQAPPVGGTQYLTADALGSTRLVTDSAGTMKRYDYLPFGEDIVQGKGGRGSEYPTAASLMFPSVPDAASMKFTGMERDAETGLDYFGARYYSGAQGRFTSPDEPLVDQWETNPQSWNLYAYGRNNPLRFADPTGQKCVDTSNGPADDGSGGGCPAAGVDTNGKIQPQQVNVNAQGGNALVAFAINAGLALSNTANDYFAWIFGQRPNVLQNTPTNQELSGQAANLTVGIATAVIGPGGEAVQAPRQIKVTWKGLLHVLGLHTGGVANKSFFGDAAAVTGLVRAAESATANPSFGGKFVRTVDAGRVIGTDITTGQPTSIYTVVTDAKGELVTAFPGNPRR